MIEADRLSYLHLAQENREEGGLNDAGREQGDSTAPTSPSAAQNPATLAIRSHALQIEDMIQAVRENRTPLVDGYAAKHPVEIILDIYESAHTHQEVSSS